MLWLKSLWNDESGSVLTAEAVLLGSMGVVGATVGLNVASESVNEELKDVSHSIRHLDQSYEIHGFNGCRARTAGSSFKQEDVRKSIHRLEELEEDLEKEQAAEKKRSDRDRRERLEELREELRREAERNRKRAEELERDLRKRAEEAERRRRNLPQKRRKPGDDDDD